MRSRSEIGPLQEINQDGDVKCRSEDPSSSEEGERQREKQRVGSTEMNYKNRTISMGREKVAIERYCRSYSCPSVIKI